MSELLAASRVIAGITWRRFWRGRTRWVVLALALLPVAFSAVQAAAPVGWDLSRAWRETVAFALRLPLLVAAAITVSTAISEELERRTHAYLFSRPIPRFAVILGKLMVAVPLLIGLFGASLVAAWLIAGAPPVGEGSPSLPRALAATVIGAVGACATSVGLGALFTRRALQAVIGYMLVFEQIASFIPTLGQLTVGQHVLGMAGVLPEVPLLAPPTPAEALTGALVVTLAWLSLAAWRVRRVEPPNVDRDAA